MMLTELPWHLIRAGYLPFKGQIKDIAIVINNRRLLLTLALSFSLTTTTLADDGPVKIACVGDSITFGAGVENREVNAYPQVLDRLLGDRATVVNFGRSGATLLKEGDFPYWEREQFTQATEFQPDIVIIKLGTNDSKPQNWKLSKQFPADLEAMIAHFRSLQSTPIVYLCKPVPVPKTAYGISEAIVGGEVIPHVEAVARKTKCRLIDLYTPLSKMPENIPDGVHPNAAGAKVMAETVYDAITRGNGKLRSR